MEEKIKNYRTAPFDARFPNTNQTRNCFQNYLGEETLVFKNETDNSLIPSTNVEVQIPCESFPMLGGACGQWIQVWTISHQYMKMINDGTRLTPVGPNRTSPCPRGTNWHVVLEPTRPSLLDRSTTSTIEHISGINLHLEQFGEMNFTLTHYNVFHQLSIKNFKTVEGFFI